MPNPDTLLGATDMVFIDAPGTGYSRPLGDAKGRDFYGVDQDADAFAKAIMRYITKFGRWDSPKFLFGESYGTTRSGALAYQLQDRGMALNGVVLLSSIMNYGRRQPGLDRDYLNYLPSYAATAWYHHKMANPPATVDQAAALGRAFAQGPYAAALEKGQTISPQERDAVAQQMSALTGLSPEYIKRANLRVDLSRFRKELMRNERRTIGRYDARYKGIDPDAAGEKPEYDASDTAISGAFIGTLNTYLARDLGYQTNMAYRASASEEEGFKWDWNHKAPGVRFTLSAPNTARDLAAAMRENPYLKVLSLNGWFDLATPFFGTEYDLGHMMLEPALRGTWNSVIIRRATWSISTPMRFTRCGSTWNASSTRRSISAGGGSIAWIDGGGFLNVGPQSAGADPGPACYGRGGTRPTVTDADLVCGYLNPGLFPRRRADARCRGVARGARRRTSPSRSRWTCWKPRPASSASSTCAWPTRCACSPPSAASISPPSRCCRSAAPARCMPRRSPRSSACGASWCRRGRARSRRSACSAPTWCTTTSAPSCGRSPRSPPTTPRTSSAQLEAQGARGACRRRHGRRRRAASCASSTCAIPARATSCARRSKACSRSG